MTRDQALNRRLKELKRIDKTAGDDVCRECLEAKFSALATCRECIEQTPRFTELVGRFLVGSNSELTGRASAACEGPR